jgi:hypothetical protein
MTILQAKATLTTCSGDVAHPCDAGAERNRYYASKLMTARDFELEQGYGIARRRLINRAMFGWGVVGGFAVTVAPEHTALEIGPGLALDRYGREIALARQETLRTSHIIWMLGDQQTPGAGRYLLAMHYAERHTAPVRVPDLCGCSETEWNHLCETVVFSAWPEAVVRERAGWSPERPCPSCGCPPKLDDSDQTVAKWRAPCLCAWDEHPPLGEPPPLCERNHLCLDPDSPVPLAWITVSEGGACPTLDPTVDDCTPRRIVKRNELLYDLIRGCDLTHLQSISWAQWHMLQGSAVAWDHFAKMFDGEKTNGDAVWTDFVIGFDGPVQDRLMNPDVIAITVIIQEGRYRRGTYGIAWGQVLRVPVLNLTPESRDDNDPGGTARSYRVWVDQKWWGSQIDEVTSSLFCEGPSTVEIEVRGDLILDCRGQTVDANSIGRRNQGPFGNGTPGGTFLSIFPLQQRSEVTGAPVITKAS